MSLVVIGVSHHTAPVEVRERFAFGPRDIVPALREIRERTGVDEAVLVSTCNRTELYAFPVLGPGVIGEVEAFFQRKAGPLPAPVGEFLYRHGGERAARHLFRVTAGLDSLVTGEAEIQGQVRDAYQRALEPGLDEDVAAFSGPVLNRLFQTALSVGGSVRNDTAIARGAASVASVAVELSRKIFGRLKGLRVLVLGAGEASHLVVEALAREGVEGVTVANRTYTRAANLAERLQGRAIQLDRIQEALADTDIVVASTGSPHALITRRTLREAFPAGLSRPLLLVDIAVPRDVAPEVAEDPRVFLYNVDDLRQIVDETLAQRREVLREADAIVRRHAAEFSAWFATLEVVPAIRALRERADAWRVAELERLDSRIGDADPGLRAEVEAFSHRLVNKLLHDPTVRIREGAAEGRSGDVLEAFRLLFGTEEPHDVARGSGPGVASAPASGEDGAAPSPDDDTDAGTRTAGPAEADEEPSP